MAYQEFCPICESPDFEYEDTQIVDDCCIQTCSCPDCDSTWDEIWAFVENRNVVDMRQTEPDILDKKTIEIITAWHS